MFLLILDYSRWPENSENDFNSFTIMHKNKHFTYLEKIALWPFVLFEFPVFFCEKRYLI